MLSRVSGPPPTPSPGVPVPSRLRRILDVALSAEERVLLHPPPPGAPGRLLRAAQVVLLAGRRYREDHAGDRAAALAFATLLSMLPLLLLGLAVFGASGVDASRLEAVQRWLLDNFVPDTARGVQETLESTLGALRAASGGLGIAGVAFLVVTGWKLLATLQRTFEQIWGVRDFASRLRRVLAFWGVVVLSPFLVAASVLIFGFLEALAASGLLPGSVPEQAAAWLLPMVPGWAGVLLVYRLFAGRRTSWRAAILGATVAAVLAEGLKLGFALYVKRAFVTRTVLSGMGVVPVFLIWLYLSWVAFLLGAELAFVLHDYDGALRRGGLEPRKARTLTAP